MITNGIFNHENIYFNLTSCSKMVLCTIFDSEVCVDIKNIDSTIDLNIAKHYSR